MFSKKVIKLWKQKYFFISKKEHEELETKYFKIIKLREKTGKTTAAKNKGKEIVVSWKIISWRKIVKININLILNQQTKFNLKWRIER